jgi:4-amino-4-deoxy-L-arabinose transferase-like glycosyltransferase
MQMTKQIWQDLAWIVVAFVGIIFVGFGLRDPWPADEPRFAAIARDMWLSGEWLIPRAGGDLYQDKPPLHFWLMALGIGLTGSLRVGFLLPSMLASLATLGLVYDLVRRLHGREAALAAALLLACTLQFVITTRGAQIDATLIFFCTLAMYASLRCLLLEGTWRWALLAGAAAGLGVIDKAVGFLALGLWVLAWGLSHRRFVEVRRPDAHRVAALLAAFFIVIALWLVPMLWHVQQSGSAELVAYRDELLFQQTVKRYTQAWHHIRPWYYYLVEVIPFLWLPLSALLPWLIPAWRRDWQARRASVWLPLSYAIAVVLFFSLSTGKRGLYILPALPALIVAASAHLPALFQRPAVQRISLGLATILVLPAVVLSVALLIEHPRAVEFIAESELVDTTPIWVFAAVAGLVWLWAWRSQKTLWAWPGVLATLTTVWGLMAAPQLNPIRSASAFMATVQAQVADDERLGLLAYKEQFLLHLERDIVNFGHARWREGDAEAYDAARWLVAQPGRVLLVPDYFLDTCFSNSAQTPIGESSRNVWFLVRGTASASCVEQGNEHKAIAYPVAAAH